VSATTTRRPSRSARNASRRRAREAKRHGDGRFKPRFDRLTLYAIVLEVSLLAAGLEPRRFADPTKVTVRAFNKARLRLRGTRGKLPRAHAICKLLSDREGTPWSWPELLKAVHDPEGDIGRVDAARLRVPPAPIDEQRMEYAALRVAYANKTRTLRRDDYAVGRERLLEGLTKRAASEAAWFAKLLPTEGQMLAHVGNDWNVLLERVGLEPIPSAKPPDSGLDRGRAIAIFYAQHGLLPLRSELEMFARERFALGGDGEQPWLPYWIDRGIDEIRALGLPEPPPFENRVAHGWTPINLDLGPLPPPATRDRSMLDVLDWVQLYARQLKRGNNPGQATWRRFAAKHDGAPSWGTLAGRGGLRKLLQLASQPDWETSARRIDEGRPTRQPKPRPRAGERPKRTRELERIAATEKAERIVALLETRGVMTASEVAKTLKIPGRTARYYIHALLASRRIDPARRIFDGSRSTAAYATASASVEAPRR
jgi:hypothetical protein